MKGLLLALLFIGATMNAQFLSFGKKEYGKLSAFVDPVGSINEKGLDVGAEIELVSYWGYVKAGFQVFPALEGGYLDTVGGAGFNFTAKPFEETRFYTGMRLGLIHRGISGSNIETYPLFGWEAGIDYDVTPKFFVGISGILDWREDFKFSGAEPEFQASGRVRFGYNFDVK